MKHFIVAISAILCGVMLGTQRWGFALAFGITALVIWGMDEQDWQL